ncbi:hypothetical protein [Nocardia acidivorans]|uniref:hypothetical protein n=1 Tax=Nocardia acidivorans TaxID=404580 RepID=UPI00082E0CA7|nr:hypothetical protein [Nocardia acidivorans]
MNDDHTNPLDNLSDRAEARLRALLDLSVAALHPDDRAALLAEPGLQMHPEPDGMLRFSNRPDTITVCVVDPSLLDAEGELPEPESGRTIPDTAAEMFGDDKGEADDA